MGKKNNAKEFVVSTADFAYYIDDVLACTGNTNLNTSLEVSVQEQNLNAGKGNKFIYSYKYGRELSATLETANWDLRYIACNVGSKITEGFTDVYKMGECITLTNGIGTLGSVPVGDIAVELPNGTIIMLVVDEAEPTIIDLTNYGLTDEAVKATYQYNQLAKSITIDADSIPTIGKLVLDSEKHNNKLGKVGSVQIVIPSYQLTGNFTINFTPDGVASSNLDGKALAVEGDSCKEGSVYAYINEFDHTAQTITISELAVTPETINLDTVDNTTATLSAIGLKGALYAPIQLENADCEFVSDAPEFVTVDENGVVTAVATGTSNITVTYGGISDTVTVTVA